MAFSVSTLDHHDLEQILWERLPKESTKAFHAFTLYRDMGFERTYRKVAATIHRNVKRIQRWATDYQWMRRVAAYDDHLARLAAHEREEAIKKMNREQANLGRAMQSVVSANIARLYEKNEHADCLHPAVIPKWTEIGVKTERNAIGAPTDVVRAIISDELEGDGLEVPNLDDPVIQDLYVKLAIREAELRASKNGEGESMTVVTNTHDGVMRDV